MVDVRLVALATEIHAIQMMNLITWNSGKIITDVMLKSCIINTAVGIFIIILINLMVFYNKTNPKLPSRCFQSTVKVKVTGQRSRW